MLIPKRIGIEQRISQGTPGSHEFPRYTADAGLRQAVPVALVRNDSGVLALGVVWGKLGGGLWARAMTDDGTLTPPFFFSTGNVGHAATADNFQAIVYEQVRGFPPDKLFGGIISAALNVRWQVDPIAGFSTPPHSSITLAQGTAYFPNPASFDPDRLFIRVFGPTACSMPDPNKVLALWHQGDHERIGEKEYKKETSIRGAIVPNFVEQGQQIFPFDLGPVSLDNEQHKSQVQAFLCNVVWKRMDYDKDSGDAGYSYAMDTVGYVSIHGDARVNVQIFDMGFGEFAPDRIFKSWWFEVPARDVAALDQRGYPP